MAVSPKVSAATVGASFTAVITGIVGPHLFPHGTPADVQGLVQAAVTAAVTFASGWFAREDTHAVAKVAPAVAKVEADVKEAETVYTKVRQAV